MPYGPQGQWRPASTIAAAVLGCRIGTGQVEEPYAPPGGKPSPEAKAKMPTPEEIARKARRRAMIAGPAPDGPHAKRHA